MVPVRQSADPRHSKLWADIGTFRDRLRLAANERHREISMELIASGGAILGIEFGSTRIKAALLAPDGTPLAGGSHAWENKLRNGVWTYDLADVWSGLAACYASLVDDVRGRYRVDLCTVAALGVSGMMHGYIALDREGELLVPFRTWRNSITGAACAELTPCWTSWCPSAGPSPTCTSPSSMGSRTWGSSPTSRRSPPTSTGS